MTELAPGLVLDERYRIDGVLGVGGFATVYRASDLVSGRLVALKMLSSELLDSGRVRARFEREIEVVSRLQCPHTVKLFGRGETPDGAPYIVFEHVRGRDLSEVLADESKLKPQVVQHIMSQVLLTLSEAHQAGVVHRDLKPANVRVFDYDGDPWRVKVLDFGVALAQSDDSARLTGANELVGTPRYMSPEQLLGEPPGPASDIYGLGIMAWELLVGQSALHGPRWGDQLARLQSGFHLAGEDEDFGELAAVIHRMTARELTKRFHSADAVLRALPSSLARTTERPARPTEQASTARITPVETLPRADNAPEGYKRPALVIGALVVILVGLGSLLLLQDSDVDEPRTSLPPVTKTPAKSGVAASEVIGHRANPAIDLGQTDATADAANVAVTPISGCGAPVAWTGRRAFRDLTAQRWRVVYLPKDFDPARNYPVVIAVQSLALPPAWMFRSTQIERLADREGLIVVSFDRSDRLTPWSRADVQFVFDELTTVAQTLCIDPTRIFVMGHGTGTELAREIACQSRVAGLALVGDLEQPQARCETGAVPVIRVAGRQDPYVPMSGGASCTGPLVRAAADIEADWRAANACADRSAAWGATESGTCRRYACEDAPFVTCHIDGGHNWPNSPPQAAFMNASCPNPRTKFPIMSTIWQFFEETATKP